MDTLKKDQPNLNERNQPNLNRNKSSRVSAAAGDLLNEGKKFVHELYEDGLDKVNEVEDEVKEYSDELLIKVQKNPLASVLIAVGVGFLLSTFLKK